MDNTDKVIVTERTLPSGQKSVSWMPKAAFDAFEKEMKKKPIGPSKRLLPGEVFEVELRREEWL